MLAKLWGGEPQEGRSHRVSLPPHFRDDKAPSAPSQGTHCPIVHLAPEGMQPKVRRVLHQSAKPWDQVLAGSSEGIRRVPGRTENGGASPTYTRGARERSALQEASVFRLRGAPRGSQDTAELTMLLSLTLLLLMGLSTCAVAGRRHSQHSAPASGGEEGQSQAVLWADGEAGGRSTSHPAREKNGESARTSGPRPPGQGKTIYRSRPASQANPLLRVSCASNLAL
ncbi:tachykinin-4 isoform X5 [Equus przewalskii]|uniref:Tachykinin-4 isoform X5 n=1 Tax=Equus przewalskii TaxID=9798 RepID=A0ABM4JLD7_EQUPR